VIEARAVVGKADVLTLSGWVVRVEGRLPVRVKVKGKTCLPDLSVRTRGSDRLPDGIVVLELQLLSRKDQSWLQNV
jgi:hypothetical protein